MTWYWKLVIGVGEFSPYFECKAETKQMALDILAVIEERIKEGADRATYPNNDYTITIKKVYYEPEQCDP